MNRLQRKYARQIRIVRVIATDDTLTVDLENGRTISLPIGWYPRLAHGTLEERARWEISGADYGIHWEDLDKELGVEGLLPGKKSNASAESFARWLERRKSDGRKANQME